MLLLYSISGRLLLNLIRLARSLTSCLVDNLMVHWLAARGGIGSQLMACCGSRSAVLGGVFGAGWGDWWGWIVQGGFDI